MITQQAKIYTSYYSGQKIGNTYGISLGRKEGYPRLENDLFVPYPEILNQWKNSAKDKAAEETYTEAFLNQLSKQNAKIEAWLDKVEDTGEILTICCFEGKGFCHRHLSGELIQAKRPHLWGGEVKFASPKQENSVITNLGKINQTELQELQEWLNHVKPYMFNSISSDAPDRKELHLRHFVKLRKKEDPASLDEVKPIENAIAQKYQSQKIEEIGEQLLPGFHQGLVLYYPKGSQIKKHADSPAYAEGAASIGLKGSATFTMYSWGDKGFSESVAVGEGDCIAFNNKQPHAIAPVAEDRWCVCFFYLKQLQSKPVESVQLNLFADESLDVK